jgi:hypothetical protein
MSDETTRVVVPIVAAVLALAALGYALMPFTAAGDVRCRGGFTGAVPTAPADTGFVRGREPQACQAGGRSRAATAGIVAFVALIGAASAVLIPPQSERDWPASWFE